MSGLTWRDAEPRALAARLPEPARGWAELGLRYVQHGAYQRSLAAMVAGASAVSAMEVGYEHYRGSYSNPVMYTPVLLTAGLTVAAGAAVFSPGAVPWMRWLSYLTVVDGVVGFGFHVRGVARKPGGWRLPITNIVMGPPLFAPLLLGTSAYLGMIASYLQREEEFAGEGGKTKPKVIEMTAGLRRADFRDDIRAGRFQKHLCVVTAVGALAAGGESWYSHYQDNFKFKVQWSPIAVSPLLAAAAIWAYKSRRAANTVLPVMAAVAMVDGVVGSYYHVRGIARRAGGLKKPLYNTLYGPPIFAPMLFAAAGLLGMMAYLMRRERE